MELKDEIHELKNKVFWKRMEAMTMSTVSQKLQIASDTLDMIEKELERLDAVTK